MGNIYYHLIKKHNHKIPFEVLIYFFITFIAARLFAYGWAYKLIPNPLLSIQGVHIHHLNFGIFILAIVGYLLLIDPRKSIRLNLAKIYGIGLALTFDEFGMWLHLDDNYWARPSYDAIIIISVVFLNIVYLGHIWQKIVRKNIIFWRKVWKKLC